MEALSIFSMLLVPAITGVFIYAACQKEPAPGHPYNTENHTHHHYEVTVPIYFNTEPQAQAKPKAVTTKQPAFASAGRKLDV